MMDIKHMDSRRHRQSTGVPNERILENAASLGRQPQPLIIRTPVIPGVNDAAEDIAAIAEFVVTLPNLLYYELCPTIPWPIANTAASTGLSAAGLAPPSADKMAELVAAAAAAGVVVRTG